MTRSVCVSEVVNDTAPLPEVMRCVETAPASPQPPQPPVFRNSPLLAATLTMLVQSTGVPGAGPAGTTGVGIGIGGAGGGDVGGGGAPGAGVVPGGRLGAGPPGMRTTNASSRLVPALPVQMKYSPVTSRLPFGSFM